MTGGGGLDDKNPASELTSTLARLDKQWKIQQSAKPQSRWTKLVLDKEQSRQVEDPMMEEPAGYPTASTENFVYLLEPPDFSRPSCMIVFVGGAGLGQFPQVAYNEFLLRLSDRLNAAVIAAPYTVGLDHFGLAKKVGELARRALIHCEDDSSRNYPSNLPTYFIGHSLGCKLASIYMAATDQQFEGIGFVSFNNFGFGQTIGMAKSFADEIQKNMRGGSMNLNSEVLGQVFNFAETIIGTIGLDFTPTPAETERLLTLKYDEDRQKKTRLFVFDDDNLDSSESFVEMCQSTGPQVSGLPGSHLTPVYFKLGLDELPEEAREMAREGLGGFESASFGNEEELNTLVDEVCDWILGKGPSRKPKWQTERPQIAGTVDDGNEQ